MDLIKQCLSDSFVSSVTGFISTQHIQGVDGRTPRQRELPQQAQGAQRREAPADEEDLDLRHRRLAGALINVQSSHFHSHIIFTPGVWRLCWVRQRVTWSAFAILATDPYKVPWSILMNFWQARGTPLAVLNASRFSSNIKKSYSFISTPLLCYIAALK